METTTNMGWPGPWWGWANASMRIGWFLLLSGVLVLLGGGLGRYSKRVRRVWSTRSTVFLTRILVVAAVGIYIWGIGYRVDQGSYVIDTPMSEMVLQMGFIYGSSFLLLQVFVPIAAVLMAITYILEWWGCREGSAGLREQRPATDQRHHAWTGSE